MQRSKPLARSVLVLCAVGLALVVLVAQIALLRNLPALATSLNRHIIQPLSRTAIRLPGHRDLPATWEQLRSRLPSLPTASSPEAVVRTVWRRAQQAGAYHFATRIVQITHPAPAIANVGTGSRVETLYIEGDANLPKQVLFLRLWQDGGTVLRPDNTLQVRVEGDKAYGRVGDGEWQPVDNFAATIAPGNDALGFLAGVRNVRPLERLTPEIQRYRFDLDGPVFADYMRTQLEEHLRRNGELPPGVYLDTPEAYRQAVGEGEIWIDGDGLPRRLIICMEFPQQASGERVEIKLQTDFSNFTGVTLAQAPASRAGSTPQRNITTYTLRDQVAQVGYAAVLLGLTLLMLVHRRSKRVYAAVVVAVIISLVFTPLLKSHKVAAFLSKQVAARAEWERQQRDREAVWKAQQELFGSDWDPHRDPLAGSSDQWSVTSGSLPSASSDLQSLISNFQSPTSNLQSPNLQSPISNLQPPSRALTAADEPPPDSDDDGDGLTYAQELRLGTDPQRKDTDNDNITDNAEVRGFLYNGKRWYSDPTNPDTNNDGLNDGAECVDKGVDPDRGDLSPENNACQDTDGDGTPDLFDRDNDNDGVPDRVDISPFSVVYQEDGSAFDDDHPFLLQVDDLEANKPVFVDFQLCPVNEDHLWYAMNVLDWPSGDEDGQIQRKRGNDSTYQDKGDPSPQGSNGDMRLIPMLEIEIPYKEGHYGNLPVLPDAPVTRTREITLGQWLDTSKLYPYGIAVRPLNDDGDLVAYVPLNVVQDETGGDRAAFMARMLYWPTNTTDTGATDWGKAQKVRVVWMVQMLVDRCVPPESGSGECQWELDIPQVVHAYPEEWYLTGLSVREDHGLDIAIAYEDPAQEPSDEARQYDDFLWALAHGLDQTFLTGRDQDGDGQRDITISEIKRRFDNRSNAGTTDVERWGIPAPAFQVETFFYDHEDGIVNIMITETQRILDSVFTPYVDRGSDAPTLLFAQESRYRMITLENQDLVAQDGDQLTLRLDPEAVQQEVRTFLSWAPYRYNQSDQKWESYPIAEYLDKLEARLKTALTEYKDDPDYEDILRGQIALAQMHYLALYKGLMSLVQVGEELVGFYSTEQSDDKVANWLNGVPIDKSAGVISRQVYTIANLMAKVVKYSKYLPHVNPLTHPIRFFKELGKSVKSGKSELVSLAKEWWKTASWRKLKLGTAIIAVTIAIGTLLTAVAFYGGGESKAAMITLNALLVYVAVIDAAITTYKIVKLIKASEVSGKFAKIKDAMKIKGLKYTGKAFAIATIVAAAVMLAAFLIAWGVSGADWGSLAFTYGLATVIASIITMILMMAIAMIPIVGQIIATILSLLDAIFMLVCEAQDREAEDFFCKGISGYVADAIRWLIFSQNIMINLYDENRLQITDFDQSLLHPELGFSVGNSLVLKVGVKNTIKLMDPTDLKWQSEKGHYQTWLGTLYWWQYSSKTLRSSTFKYYLENSGQDHHSGLSRGQIPGYRWEPDDCKPKDQPCVLEETKEIQIPLNQAGLNRPVSLYLNEGYAVPAQECWLIVAPPLWYPIPVCYIRTEKDTNNIDLGKYLHFDVFPSTLDDFYSLTAKDGGYALAWGQDTTPSFPRLKDADGDGLRNKADGGADPDDRDWDTDNDGLSDFLEIRNGTNPQDADSDNDGLTDRAEIILGTNPNLPDSDYDGLTDKEELDGWEFVYDFAPDGSQLSTWVTSDPTSMDGDGDMFTDFQEKVFGFHPRVPTDPNLLTFESRVTELKVPRLLLRLDETANAVAFRDDSGYANNAGCQGNTCPVAGHRGKYGNAPLFDGVDDYLEVPHRDTLNAGDELTLAAWVRLDDPNANQKIVGKTNTTRGYLLGVAGGQLYVEVWDDQGSHYAAWWGSIPAGTWTHLAVTWQSGGDLVGYINGQEVGRISASIRPIGATTTPLRIGAAPWDSTAFLVKGRIDEVVMIPKVLSQAEIEELAAGRHNPQDLAVRPGDTLHYEAKLKNELFNRYAQGLLSTHFPAAFSELPPQSFVLNPQEAITLSGNVDVSPAAASGVYTLTQEADAMITDWREASDYADMLFHFDEAAGATTFADSSGAQPPRDASCTGSHCPTAGEAGRYGYAVRFDGVDDYLEMPKANTTDLQYVTLAAWIYPETLPSGKMMRFITLKGDKAVLRYDGVNPPGGPGQLHLYMRINGRVHHLRVNNILQPGRWQFVAATYNGQVMRLYHNGIEVASKAVEGRLSGEDGVLISHPTEAFHGRMDEVVIYPRALSAADIQALYNRPVFHLKLDEDPGATTFRDASGFGNAATCTGDACPTAGQKGISGEAVAFDGKQFLEVSGNKVLDLDDSPITFTLSAWVYPTGGPADPTCPFTARYGDVVGTGWAIRYVTCEDFPIEHDWGTGSPASQVSSDNFFGEWEGSFYFEEGDYTFVTVHDDAVRIYIDGRLVFSNAKVGEDRFTIHLDEGYHTIKATLREYSGIAYFRLYWSPYPAYGPQGILGGREYPSIQRINNNEVRIVLPTDTGVVTATTDADVLKIGEWNHVAATYDGTTWAVYVNGVLQAEASAAGQTPSVSPQFHVGHATDRAQLHLLRFKNTSSLPGIFYINSRSQGGTWQTVWIQSGICGGCIAYINKTVTFQGGGEVAVWGSTSLGTRSFDIFAAPMPEHVETFQDADSGVAAEVTWTYAPDSIGFRGRIDEVSIYRRALSAAEVEDLYYAGQAVLHLPLDDAPGSTTFADVLGGRNGVCASGATCPTAGVPGRDQMALLFDGADDYVTVNKAGVQDLKELTVAAWVRFNSLPNRIMRFVTLGSDEKAVLRYENGDFHFYIRTDDDVFHHLRPGLTLQTGVWYHVVGTYDGTTMRLYVNGVEVASQDVSRPLIRLSDKLRLSSDAEPLDGYLDDVWVFRRALSAADVQALYRRPPEMLLLLDETSGATTFADATGNGHDGTCSGVNCPKPGAKGQLGLAAEFDGMNDHIRVPHSDALNPNDEMTLAVWVKLTDTDPDQKLVGKSSIGDGFVLGIKDGQLYPEVWDTAGTRYWGQWGRVSAGYWTHLAFTWKKGDKLIAYINGQPVGSVDVGDRPIKGNTRDLIVGIAPWDTLSYPANGRIDQVTLYTRALSPSEIRELYRYQAKWIEERQHAEVTVDAEAPRSALVSDETYRANRDVQLLVTADDPTTFVTLVEMGVSTDGGATYTWEAAPRCVDAAGETAWCPTFTPTVGEGRYLLQFRATDNVGHRETPAQTYTFLVDDTPPQAATAIADGQILGPVRQPDNTWLLRLEGTVSDPPVAGSPGSGVASVQVKLTNTASPTDTLSVLEATLNGDNWQVDYPLLVPDPTGTYTLSVQATDNVGNTTGMVPLITLGVDAAPPRATLDPIEAATGLTGTITTTLQIGGRITETGVVSAGVGGLDLAFVPAAMASLSDTVAIFHFEEPAGATRFASDTGDEATCQGNACPTAGVPGVWGSALSFDGVDDYLSADFVAQRITDTNGLAFGAWVYVSASYDGSSRRAILAFDDGSGSNRNELIIQDSRFCYADPQASCASSTFATEQWYQVMVVIEEDGDGTLYVDGQAAVTFQTNVRPDPNGRFNIGREWWNWWSTASYDNYFPGKLDEITVYDRALSPSEVHSFYADATLDTSGQGVISSAWTYAIPEGLDGLYQLLLRPTDVVSNAASRRHWPVWTGEVDTRAPEVDLTVVETTEQVGSVQGAPILGRKTSYTCWARDLNLYVRTSDDDGVPSSYDFQCPCQQVAPSSTTVTRTFYHEVSPWYAETFTDTARLYEYTESCTISGPPPPTVSNYIKACDLYGRCAEKVVATQSDTRSLPNLYTAILTPTHKTILTSTAAINIEGHAYAQNHIQNITVYDGLTPIGTAVNLTCPSNITTTQWSLAWLPVEGVHDLNARITDCTGKMAPSNPVQVYVDTTPPAVNIWPTSLNRDQRLSYGRVRLSGQVSDLTTGVDTVQVQVDGSWRAASIQGNTWSYDWYLGQEPDNAQYTVSVRATDRAGWTTRVTETVTVDLDQPNPITLTMTSDVTAGGVVSQGTTLRQVPATLTLTWQAGDPPTKLSHYEVAWRVHTVTQTQYITTVVPPAGPLSSQYIAGEPQRVDVQVTSVFTDGNRQVDTYGPVYVDTPLTPDYVTLTPPNDELTLYHGWMDSGCARIGVDRRVQQNAQATAAIQDPQNFYVSWDSEGLRLAWTGANWDYAGDLFIYLDTSLGSGPFTSAFNPYTGTQGTTIDMPNMDTFIWVRNSQEAWLYHHSLNNDIQLDERYFRFDGGLRGGLTDLYIPFDLLGITNPATTPLVLVAFATEENAMRLWSTMPAVNPVNSDRVVETLEFAGANHVFELLHTYVFPSLGPGICPNNPTGLQPFAVDSDLKFGLTATPAGSTYSFMGDGLFWLWDALSDPNRLPDLSESFTFMDVEHPPVGHGDVITYTLTFANRGTITATGVTAQVVAGYALRLQGTNAPTMTLNIGDIPPGATGSLTFQGVVDTVDPYNDCIAQGGDPTACQTFLRWATLQVLLYSDAYTPLGLGFPLDWLWADHRVDSAPPKFFGILDPAYFIGAGHNLFSGYAYDPSGVPTVTIEAQPPGSGSHQTVCTDASSGDGQWNCTWDATAANGGTPPADGDQFLLHLQATDADGQVSGWTKWRTYVVDTVPPTVTLSAETTLAYSGTVVNATVVRFSGTAGDNHGIGGVEACLDGACEAANVQTDGVAAQTYDDDPGTPLTIGACGGGEIVRTFVVTQSFTVGDVSLGFNADHPRRDEILATLTSPAGTTVQVIAGKEGSPSRFQNYDVFLNDAAANGLHDAKANDDTAAPYYDRLARPNAPLRDFWGEDALGTWTLTVCDINPTENQGTYNRSQLVLAPQNVAVPFANWFYAASGLENQDYVSHTLTVLALDLAGNRSSEPVTLTLWVDNMAPVITVTGRSVLTATGATPMATRVLSGTVTDGGQIRQMYAFVVSPSGNVTSMSVGRSGDAWWFDLTPEETGDYKVWINAVDEAGNAVTAGPFTVTFVHVLADNNSPTALGTATALTATLLGDSGFTYTWDFGDGSPVVSDQSSVISHSYPAVGVYTATVTATKAPHAFTATTTVLVEEPISGLALSDDGPTTLGNATTFTATITAGSNVSYTWDFGDGASPMTRQGPVVFHTYATTGTYTATVTAYNAVSAVTATTTVNVFPEGCTAADLSVALVGAETAVGALTPITLTARVQHEGGSQVAAGLPAAFYVDGALIGTAATTHVLNAGQSETVSVVWDAAGPGDYQLRIVLNDDGTGAAPLNLCTAPPEAQQTVSILDVPLVEGWNLISSYVNPFTTDASVVQLPIAGQYVVIQGFDQGAQSYYPDLPPQVNTLKDIEAEHGYWVKVKPAGTQGNSGESKGTHRVSPEFLRIPTSSSEPPRAFWRFVGTKFAEDRPIELDAGWNLVSYLPRTSMPITQALQSIDGQYTAVLGFDQGALSYYPDIDPSFNTLHEMEPLHGYWIKMAQAGTLRYPTTTQGDLGKLWVAQGNSGSASPPSSLKFLRVPPSPAWVNFYGTAHLPDGMPLPVGTTVLALDPDGVMCGGTVVTIEGQYGLLACYGDDPTTPEDEGAQPGDTIQLVAEGQVLAIGTWTEHGDRQWRPLGKVELWQVYLPLIRKGIR